MSIATPWLSLLILSMPTAAVLIALAPAQLARWIALLGAAVGLLIALWILALFDPSIGSAQLSETHLWIPSLNIHYRLGIDGFSIGFLPLSMVLLIGVILMSWQAIRFMPRVYYSLLLILESTTLGVFCAQDLILFFLFWELTLIPVYFLVSLWGNGTSSHSPGRFAAMKYTLMMLAGGAAILLGFVVIATAYAGQAGSWTFDYTILSQASFDHATQMAVFFLLLLGFLLKTPAVPMHTWLPRICMDGPAAIAASMTGIKLGAFGLIRYALPLAPEIAHEMSFILTTLGVAGLLYGGLIALTQTNLRLMLAYASVSHVGLVLIGIGAFSMQGIQGAIFQLWNFTLISGGLFLLLGFLQQRTQTLQINTLGGLHQAMPRLTTAFFFLGVASIGLPGTSGFPAEFLLIMAALRDHMGVGLAVLLSVVLGAAYFLSSYRRAFLGKPTDPAMLRLVDLNPRETTVAAALVLLILFAGLFPQKVLELSHSTAELWLQRLAQ